MNQRATINCLRLLLIGAIAGAQSGCEDMDKAESMDPPVSETLAMVPTDVWLDDEMATSDHFYNSTPAYTLYAELKSTAAPLELHFNNQKSIFAAEVLVENAPNHVFFFQNKRVVYSEHTGDSGELWKVAYANNTAYAAATRSEGSTWKSMDHHRLPLSQNVIREIISQVARFENGADNSPERLRPDSHENSVRDTLFANEEITVLLNAKAGDELALGIQSPSPHIYFTLSHQQSRMEHKNWRGKVAKSGDIEITVFSLIENEVQPFRLSADLISR